MIWERRAFGIGMVQLAAIFVLPDRAAGKKRRVRTSLSLQFADFEAPEVENTPVMPFNF
jgi:hypothetical protein